MKYLLLFVGFLLVTSLIAMSWQHMRYTDARRNAAQDHQNAFHDDSVFHVVTFLKTPQDQDVIEAVRGFRAATGGSGKWIYAGKVVVNAQSSAQLGETDWSAVILVQYDSRDAYDSAAAAAPYQNALGAFNDNYAHGARRSATENLILPQVLLLRSLGQVLSNTASAYPFEPASGGQQSRERSEVMANLRAERELGKRAAVVVNLQKLGSAEQQAADAEYVAPMLTLMAELGYGPMHSAAAERLPGGHDFDRVVIVYYPGVDYFADMIGSTFYQGIYADKQLGDNQSTITVPILDRL